jgi:hypothetical protein
MACYARTDMLDPDDRLLLLDALRPPAGFAFDRAVGTSFTLDLHALLTTPLALAAFDWEASDGAVPDDPVALLESLRRCSDRIDFFCQAGEISIPPAYHRLYTWLERSVHEATPRQQWAVFHPKVWLLRYRALTDGDPNAYRLLCASRNLTFDRNWDLLIVLDGTAHADANGEPVASFVDRLPSLAVHRLSASRRREISSLATEVAGVRFTPPEGFDGVGFHFLDGRRQWPLPDHAERLLVVSPFVSEDATKRLLAVAPRVTIVSRAEELDRLPSTILEQFDARLVLSPAAVPTSELSVDEDVQRPLVGLHAKLYVAETGKTTTWFAGSANATGAAFGGNVEALVEMSGAKRAVGIDSILGDANDTGLARLLQEHPLPETQVEESEEEALQRVVDDLRRAMATTRFTVTLSSAAEGYAMTVTAEPLARITSGSATIIVRPLSLPTGMRVTAGSPVGLTFGPVSLESITPFLVVEIVARHEGVVVQDACVVRGELVNEPEDRGDRLLASLLASRRDVLRYLLFLLADAGGGSPSGWFGDLQRAVERGAGDAASDGALELPLLETLVRTVARDPAKLTNVRRLVDALGKTDEGRALLPEGFAEVWPVIWEAANPNANGGPR